MTSTPRIAAIMAVRNGERWLEESVGSVLGQTFGDFELVLIDNGSTDRSPAILANLARLDSRIVLLSRGRPGLADCLRLGIAHSRAPFIARLDADDCARSDRFERQLLEFDSAPALGLLGSQATIIDHRARPIARLSLPLKDGEIRSWLPNANPFCHSSVMMRREVYERVGGYRQGLRFGEDRDLWLRMARFTDLANCGDYLVSHRIHSSSLTQRHPVKFMIAGLRTSAIAAGMVDSGDDMHKIPPRLPMRECFDLVHLNRKTFRHQIARHWWKQLAKRIALFFCTFWLVRTLAVKIWR